MNPAQHARVVAIAEAYSAYIERWDILRVVSYFESTGQSSQIDTVLDEIVEELEQRRQPSGEGQLSLLIENHTFVMPGE